MSAPNSSKSHQEHEELLTILSEIEEATAFQMPSANTYLNISGGESEEVQAYSNPVNNADNSRHYLENNSFLDECGTLDNPFAPPEPVENMDLPELMSASLVAATVALDEFEGINDNQLDKSILSAADITGNSINNGAEAQKAGATHKIETAASKQTLVIRLQI